MHPVENPCASMRYFTTSRWPHLHDDKERIMSDSELQNCNPVTIYNIAGPHIICILMHALVYTLLIDMFPMNPLYFVE